MKHAVFGTLAILVSCYLSETGFSQKELPKNLAAGASFGAISTSPTANQTAFHWLKQKGTVWDAATAVLFELLLKAPHMVSLHSDMAVMIYQPGSKPSFYWLSNFDLADPTKVWSSSQWPGWVLAQHQKFSKFPLDQIATLSLLAATQGWTIPKEFWTTLHPLTQLPLFKKYKNSHQKIKNLSAANLIKNMSQHQFPTPSSWPVASSHQITYGSRSLFALDKSLLSTLRSHTDMLWNLKNLDPEALLSYLKKLYSHTDHLTTPYVSTFGMVLFDRYGTVLAFNMGLPSILNSYEDPTTQLVAHSFSADKRSRVWSLSPWVAQTEGGAIQFVTIPQIYNLDAFIQSFPLSLFQTFKLGHFLTQSLDTPQFHLVSADELHCTHPTPVFTKSFKKIKVLEPPNTLTGLEVWPTTILGFTPNTPPVKPLMF